MTSAPRLDPDFVDAVERHVFGNILLHSTESPLILGIFGPPGEGKTFQVEHVCRAIGVKQQVISPGELESENAGHPAQLLRTEYLRASAAANAGDPTVLVVNDIDTVLGHWGSLVQYTVNRQIVFGQLMAFCDYPSEVAGKLTNRVPIIITGNNPGLLYGPMLRPGRSRIYTWAPSLEVKLPIIAQMFPGMPERDLAGLVSQHPDQPVSFWTDVRAAMWEARLGGLLHGIDRETLIGMLRGNEKITLDVELADTDDVRATVTQLTNHDGRGRTFADVSPDHSSAESLAD